jgi:hypothetical protein
MSRLPDIYNIFMTVSAIDGRRIEAMTLDTHRRLIVAGFYLLFLGGMGAMVGSSTELFPEYTRLAVRLILLPAAVVGCGLIAIAKLGRVDDE